MNTYRKTAVLVGIFFIIGTAAGVLGVVVLGPFMDTPKYLKLISENESQVVIGALLILTMGFALTMVPVLLYPIFRKYNHALALAAVIFRGALEAVVYILQAMIWLLLLSVSQQFSSTSPADPALLQQIGNLLFYADGWAAHILSIVFSLGALMIYWLFYRTKLIPRWLSVWGLVGGLLYFVVPMVGLFGMEWGFLVLPLALQEMVLALWLIIKGFNSTAIASLGEKQI